MAFVRITRVKRGTKVYEYPQLVQSVRGANGIPTHRVIASLKDLTPDEIKNIRLALTAGKEDTVSIVSPDVVDSPSFRVLSNYDFLDVGVAWEIWRELGLQDLLSELFPKGRADVSPAHVLAGLVIQRCVSPGSKLFAERWFPRTALPELLDIRPKKFNYTRIHRALDLLQEKEAVLQDRLPLLYKGLPKSFGVLFTDVTDTWFVGRGPEAAEKGKTKEGIYQRKIGIVMMCDQDGFPLRWEVIPGTRSDSRVLLDLLDDVRGFDWIEKHLVVADRALGKTSHVRALLGSDLLFLTALTRDEFPRYAGELPELDLEGVSFNDEDAVEHTAQALEATEAMTKVSDDLYVMDRGVVEIRSDDGVEFSPSTEEDSCPLRQALLMARSLREQVQDGVSYREIGREIGLSKTRVHCMMKLLGLAGDIQEAILSGHAHGLAQSRLHAIADLSSPQEQRAAFDKALAERRGEGIQTGGEGEVSRRRRMRRSRDGSFSVRVVATFNPEVCVKKRKAEDEKLAAVNAFVRDLNAGLSLANSRMSKDTVYARIDAELRKRNLLGIFDIDICQQKTGDRKRWRATLKFKEAAWRKRRRHDGFSVLVAHPDVMETGEELAIAYRKKNEVERDFRTIKSQIKLRPVHHRKDPKVKAHVSVCMLALAVEREIERRLSAGDGGPRSAEEVFEHLGEIHLSPILLQGEATPVYSMTEVTEKHLRILKRIGLERLSDSGAVARKIQPRT